MDTGMDSKPDIENQLEALKRRKEQFLIIYPTQIFGICINLLAAA